MFPVTRATEQLSTLVALQNIIGDCIIHKIPFRILILFAFLWLKKRSLFINRKTSNENEAFISLLPSVAFVKA